MELGIQWHAIGRGIGMNMHPRPGEPREDKPRERDNEHPDPQEDRPNSDERINEREEDEARREAGLEDRSPQRATA